MNKSYQECIATVRAEKPSLTGLRGVAAVAATLFHFQINNAFFPLEQSRQVLWRFVGEVIHRGYLAVDLFFVLSGFVMALSYANMFAGRFTWQNYGTFLRRRLARVYPLYLVMTLVSAGVLWLHADRPRLDGILCLNIAMVQAWGFADSLDGPAWSISTEWAAYLIFPVLAGLALLRSRAVAVALAITCGTCILMIAALPDSIVAHRLGGLDAHDSSSGIPLPLMRCLSEFCIGLLAYRAASLLRLGPAAAGAVAAAAAALIVVLLTLPDTDAEVVLLFAVLILGLSYEQGLVSKILGSRLPHGLGVLSYAIYLLHFRFISLERMLREHLPSGLADNTRQLIALIVVFALLIAASFCAYEVIEKPARRWLRSSGSLHAGLRRSA